MSLEPSARQTWHRSRTVGMLGVAQTLAWASTYYLPAILAAPMASDIGVSTPFVFGAFSLALVVAAACGPHAGRAIDRWGGRLVLSATSLLFALGLAVLGLASNAWWLLAAWVLIGIGMASGLYESAFATLVRIYGADSRGAITGVTLIAGLASTVGWPLSTLLEAEWGWRATCWAWAGLHLVLGLPLNFLLPRVRAAERVPAHGKPAQKEVLATPAPVSARWTTFVLAFVFAVTWFISTAMAAHLPTLLQACGVAAGTSVLVGMLIGPAQVGARLLEYGLLRKVHPLVSARIAAALHPVGALGLLVLGPPAALVFGLLHGAGNGILTIAKGTLPLAIFGTVSYGYRQGLLMVPARVAQALAPWMSGVALAQFGAWSLGITAALSIVATVLLGQFAMPRNEAGESR